ncbi:hypothetical protein SMACR_06296 [Sordaria macrospora]|uniref:WGS project CABT00000000 data, contig 2.34 n=2 Tax=Sordaria macrospora TaxID=5147 RepID=F7W6D9_SORMK|nr:uncharacterized protein SMAC_06296 [Sordaria macrospora k-hell]KAA8635213.1 hypothetical protein SMACR_06296 [Sordaria macrospora]KAH7630426.1 hypothetical protein B0T09DRAFT_264627 [Sordaria sp. MPI-SDFR-AT-0083]WPJ67093.1 hypothetical protein SMAC4_06296 [Sordaria macrospora]CCC13078.1 unnamed protein product [Sordaria macrospora k-hell]
MPISSPSSQNGLFPESSSSPWAQSHHPGLRAQARTFLSSKTKHYIVLALVAVDIASIVADILVALVACDLKQEGAKWVSETREGLHMLRTLISSLFLVELAGMIWAFGAGFAVDVVMLVMHGDGIEEIAELIIVLRLWRLIKIIEELGVGLSEGMEQMRRRVEELERILN